ncbi:MAG: hypothetical protein QM642_11055 [Edaphocola sp.]
MQDVLLDEDYDLMFEAGDLSVGRSELQQQELLLVLPKTAIKSAPNATVGLEDYINDNDTDGMCAEIRRCFMADGMSVNRVNYNEQTSELSYDASCD